MRDTPEHEGRRWLEQASEDLRWARKLTEDGGFHIACFLSQQVAEKALKAFLYARGEDPVLGHSVGRLCGESAAYDARFEELCGRWAILDGYYVPTRYPNGLPDGIPAHVYNQAAARDAVGLAGEVVDFVSELLA